jgi:hypothetical protein
MTAVFGSRLLGSIVTILPFFFNPPMMHEESGIGLDPTFSLEAEASAGDHQNDSGIVSDCGGNSLLKYFARCCGQRQCYLWRLF